MYIFPDIIKKMWYSNFNQTVLKVCNKLKASHLLYDIPSSPDSFFHQFTLFPCLLLNCYLSALALVLSSSLYFLILGLLDSSSDNTIHRANRIGIWITNIAISFTASILVDWFCIDSCTIYFKLNLWERCTRDDYSFKVVNPTFVTSYLISSHKLRSI